MADITAWIDTHVPHEGGAATWSPQIVTIRCSRPSSATMPASWRRRHAVSESRVQGGQSLPRSSGGR